MNPRAFSPLRVVTTRCPRCGTVYFAEQECDWCPATMAIEVEEVEQLVLPAEGEGSDGSVCGGRLGVRGVRGGDAVRGPADHGEKR